MTTCNVNRNTVFELWELYAGANDFGFRDEIVTQAIQQMYTAKGQVSAVL